MSEEQARGRQGLEERFQAGALATHFQVVDITFATADVDTVVEHNLRPAVPEHAAYIVLQSSGPANIYHDMAAARRPWASGTLLLRSDTANVRVRLLVMLPAAGLETALTGVGVTGATALRAPQGAFTPTLAFGGSSAGITYGTREGYYVKAGRQVFFTLRTTLTNKGAAAGDATITGLPFTHDFGVNAPATASVGYGGSFAGLTSPPSFFVNGTPAVVLVQWGATGVTALNNTHFTNTTDALLTGSYRATV